jgi:putative protease
LRLVRENLGVQRVVVPRELDVDEIKAMASACPAGLSLEVFVHGALCYGVSGRCYWSSFLGGKSGLRGRCVQPCRRLYGQDHQRKRFFSCQDLSLDVLAKVLLAIPQVTAWKIEGRKKGPHYVYHTVKAYRLLRDQGTDPAAKKEALGLLALSLGRPGTHYRFLSQRVQNPVKTDVQTGSGLLVGRIKGAQRRPYVVSREALLPGDVLRLGYEDERWHGVQKVRKFVPKRGRLDLRIPSSGYPRKGTPVFLVDRREKHLEQALSELEGTLANQSQGRDRLSTFRVRLPKKSRKRMKPLELRVYRKVPGGRQQGLSGGKGPSVGLWLSSKALKASCQGNGKSNLWWWLPPVVWPKDEENLKELLDRAFKGGWRNFVLNAPWQCVLFAQRKRMNLWAGPFCNLANPLAIGTAASLGCAGAIVSPELGGQDLLALPQHSPIPLGIVISGNWPLSIGRTVSQELQTDSPFASPKGEEAWVSIHGPDCWVYPNWILDIHTKKEDLKRAGYSLFVHLLEPKPKAVKMKKRPGLWNWELGLT